MKLEKIFTEIRFEPSFLFEDGRTRSNIVKDLKRNFPHYEYNEEQKVIAFINHQNKAKCFMYNDKVIVDIDEPRDLTQFKSIASDTIPKVLTSFEIEQTSRIGIRAHYHDDSITSATETNKAIVERFFNLNGSEFIKQRINDENFKPNAGFSFTINNEFQMTVNVGVHQSVSGKIDEQGKLQVTGVEATNPICDMDMFSNVPKKPDQINGMLRFACEEIPLTLKKIWG
ncbi:hypothetical protein ACIOBL_01610 [Paenibacillus taichungensis]|uniref:hypothetical protein n=1 Tax=Paenibacillus taichungensis TaxID=484184 RepID=UPI0038293536